MSLLTNLIAHWKLNEASGSRSDSVGSNTLTDHNSVLSGTGKIGDAASFVAASSQYLSCADNTDLSLGSNTDFTFSLWIKPTTTNALRCILQKNDDFISGLTGEYEIYHFSGGTLRFTVGNGTTSADVTSSTTLTDGNWFFIVCWYSSADQKIYIQVNNGTPDSTAWTGGTQNTARDFAIGAFSGGGFYFDGLIDSVSFWKRTLTSDECTTLYDSGSGLDYPFNSDITSNLTAWYKFNEGSGTSITDSSGNANTGTLVNTPSYVAGKIGSNALSLAGGSTQYATLPSGASIVAGGGDFSVGFWIKFTTTTRGIIWGQGSTSDSTPLVFVDINPVGQTAGTVGFRTRDDSGNLSSIAVTTNALNDGTWHHVVFTGSGTHPDRVRKIYVDGALGGTTLTTEAFISATTNSYEIGALQNGSSTQILPITASIDELRLYSRELTSDDVTALFNYTEPSGGGVISKINSVAFANITKVNGVAIGSVKKYNGVAAQ